MHFADNASIDISIDCAASYGGGGSGGNDDELYNVLAPNFHGGPDNTITWKQDGVDICDVQTTNNARYPGHGPSTLLIVISCSWENDIITVNSTSDDRPVEELAADATHAVLGVVTQIESVPYNVTAVNATEPIRETVFTEVTLVVNEDLKGAYNATLMTLRFEGGIVDNLRVVDTEAPRFELGEYVFVLVGQPDENGRYQVVGQANGKYQIATGGFARTDDYERFTTVDELRALFGDDEPADTG